ncbi:hypothetical protein SK128_011320, partial [Halocaridina rubra]
LVNIASINDPGNGSWSLRRAGVWESGHLSIKKPLWPTPPLNLHRRTVRITCIQVFEYLKGGSLDDAKGFVGDMMRIIRNSLNFTEILVPADGFGLKEANGSWNGMVGVLYRKEADVAPLDFSPSLSRTEAVEFGQPFGEDVVVILSRAPSIVIKPFLLLQIFSIQ